MRILLISFLIFTSLLFTPLGANAQRDGIHAYAAMGINFTPMSFRVGYKDWEIGMLNRAYGFDKIFDIGPNYYSSFGFVYTGRVGVFAGIGTKFDIWIIPFRCEISAYIDHQASGFASGLIGLTYGF